MSILIKGMEMPTSCEKCPFEREILSRYVCAISGKARNWGLETKLSDCPLVPVPPHGRLIDADALLDDLLFPSKQFEQGMRELIGDAPTVIPAEETLKEATNDQNNS